MTDLHNAAILELFCVLESEVAWFWLHGSGSSFLLKRQTSSALSFYEKIFSSCSGTWMRKDFLIGQLHQGCPFFFKSKRRFFCPSGDTIPKVVERLLFSMGRTGRDNTGIPLSPVPKTIHLKQEGTKHACIQEKAYHIAP